MHTHWQAQAPITAAKPRPPMRIVSKAYQSEARLHTKELRPYAWMERSHADSGGETMGMREYRMPYAWTYGSQ